jgi:hypothetical protein
VAVAEQGLAHLLQVNVFFMLAVVVERGMAMAVFLHEG